MTLAFGMTVPSLRDDFGTEPTEMLAMRNPRPEDVDSYERVLTDGMAGDATVFAREDHVEEAWRIVDHVLTEDAEVHCYAPNTWGPPKFLERSGPQGGGTTPWSCQPLRMTTLRIPKRHGSRSRDTGFYTEARY